MSAALMRVVSGRIWPGDHGRDSVGYREIGAPAALVLVGQLSSPRLSSIESAP